MNARADESFARDLLCNYFSGREAQPQAIQLVSNDPPDVLIQWPHEEIWGVEVTRLYDAAQLIGNEDQWVSSEDIRRALERLGKGIEKKTRTIRKRGYTLLLQGPSPLDPFSNQIRRPSYKEWGRAVTEAICEHIARGRTETLKGSGFRLTPGNAINAWLVLFGAGAHAIEPALHEALQNVLQNKEGGLPRWTVTCSQRWLLILNCYLLADDADATKYIRRLLGASTAHGFDGVFWSGYPDRELKSLERVR